MRRSFLTLGLLATTLLAAGVASAGPAQTRQEEAGDELAKAFVAPPQSARPRVWWHWMNGNVSAKGVDADLDWMARVGIGGVHNFDIGMKTPQVVPERLVYMTPEWKSVFRQAVERAAAHGFEFAIATSPGFSETGGPWVSPTEAMKKLVWTETVVRGGAEGSVWLPRPSDGSGPYQGLSTESDGNEPPRLYQDIAVLAVPTPAGGPEVPVSIRANGKPIDPGMVDGSHLDKGVPVSTGTPASPHVVEIGFAKPVTLRSMTLFMPGAAPVFDSGRLRPTLEALVGGREWAKVADVTLAAVPITVGFDAVTATRFRLVFTPNPNAVTPTLSAAPGVVGGGSWAGPRGDPHLSQLTFSSQPRVNEFQLKDGFSFLNDYYALGTGAERDDRVVRPADVLDLTTRMDAAGRLAWAAPPGSWTVLRLGYSLTGKTNHPASPEATGLEVDKMDGAAVSRYLDRYLDSYRTIAGPDTFGAHGINTLLTDSIEAGPANWTPRMVEQFKRLRGYDPTPWLPVLAGLVIGSRRQSDDFLYDFRRTIADLIATEHYGTIATVAHRNGLKLYGEAVEGARWSLGDDVALRRFTDVPMAAMWTYQPGTQPQLSLLADMKGAASVAHLYGQNLVAAESLTAAFSPWAWSPASLRPIIDLEFAYGINRPVIHTSIHQPVDDKLPGLSLGPFGQYFNRHETWAEMAKPWVDYMARSSVLLQAGVDHADVAYFFGEEAPLIALFRAHADTDAPTRYAYDYVDPDGLANQLSVVDGDLVGRHGSRYRALYLGRNASRMTLPVLRRVAALAEAGATVIGTAPTGSPSLADDAADYHRLVARLWPGGGTTPVGRGRVVASSDLEASLAGIGVTPDVSFAGLADNRPILFVHRTLPDGDVYYLTNRSGETLRTTASFRVSGRMPELWRADDGSRVPLSYRFAGASTEVPLTIAPEDSFFVVFRRPTAIASRTVPATAWRSVATLDDGWDVSFEGLAAPGPRHLDRLRSLSESDDPATRYFSGRATYSKIVRLPGALKPGQPVRLSLGTVGDVAEVRVNGRMMGTAWRAPFEVDIGPALRMGENRLEIKVADLWVNRLIGDAQPGAVKVTYTSLPTYEPTAPLRPSGLIGPVTLEAGTSEGTAAVAAGKDGVS